MNSERWMQASLENQVMARKVRKAIRFNHSMHLWAMDILTKHWLESMQILTVNEMQPMMTYWIREEGGEETVQRYSLDAALSRTILHFNHELRPVSVAVTKAAGGVPVQETATILMPRPIKEKDWGLLDVQSRQVWQRYIEDYGRITTAYGTVFLEGNWTQEMLGYAEDLGVRLELLPHLWSSASIKEAPPPEVVSDDDDDEKEEHERWLVRFNFFKPEGNAAKRRTGKGKLYVEEA